MLTISGFSDEIATELDEQISVVKKLGLHTISLRGIDGKNVGEYTCEEFEKEVYPRLRERGIQVSSIGSPIGKIFINDEEGFKKQQLQLSELCKIANLLECNYIRVFSFYIPKGDDPQIHENEVIKKMYEFVKIAESYHIVLLHENEKDIYGDIASRCFTLSQTLNSKSFKLIFDFANFVQVHENTLDAYHLLKSDIEYIHIKDAIYDKNENVVCGSGDGQIETILSEAILDGYDGFLTLEPHLAMFDSLKDLELEDASEIIKENKAKDGATGYEMQLDALNEILTKIKGENENEKS